MVSRILFGTEFIRETGYFRYQTKPGACFENKASTGANSNVICRNRTSADNCSGITRKYSVLHDTALP